MSTHLPTGMPLVCIVDGQRWPCDTAIRIVLRCQECGAAWTCDQCHRWERMDWMAKPRPCLPREHDSAARVQGWTVWRESMRSGNRTTILCPNCRESAGIVAHARPLPERSAV